jgi:formyl-CoA transferase
MLDTGLMLMSSDITNMLASDEPPDPDKWDWQGHPGYRLYDTAAGVLMAGAWTAEQTTRFWKVLGRLDRASDAERRTIPDLESAPMSVITEVQRVMLTRTADEWERLLNGAQVPASQVRTLAEAVGDPQVAHRGTLDRPADSLAGMVAAFIADRDGPSRTFPPPAMGRDTEEILRELGVESSQITALRSRGVI